MGARPPCSLAGMPSLRPRSRGGERSCRAGRGRGRRRERERKGDVLDEAMEDGQRPSAAANGVVAPPLPPAALATKPRAGTVDGSKRFTPETQASVGSQGGRLPRRHRCQPRGKARHRGSSRGKKGEGRRERGAGDAMRLCHGRWAKWNKGRRVPLQVQEGGGGCACAMADSSLPPSSSSTPEVEMWAHPLRCIVVNPFPSAFP
ncbi:unnamed protein product [Musa textilis]